MISEISNSKYILGVDRNKKVKSNDWLIYDSIEMKSVKIFTIYFNSENDEKRKAELYYPPDYDFKTKIPALILFAVKKYPMDRGSYVSWAEILATKGIVAITYEAPDYINDFKHLLDYILNNKNYLSINKNKIGVMAFCGALNRYFSIDYKEIIKYNLSYGVFFSGTIPSPNKYKFSYPLLIVNSGKDYKVCTHSFLRFKKEADKLGIKYKMIDYPDGIHRFDAFQPTEESKEIIKMMLEEINNDLFEN